MTLARKKKAAIKIVKLPTFKSEVDEDVIKKLEELLEQAKKGKLNGFAYAALMSDNSSKSSYTKTLHIQAMLGAVSILQYRMLDNWVEK